MGQGLQRAVSLGKDGAIEELLGAGLRDRDYDNLLVGARLREFGALASGCARVVCDCADSEPGLGIARFLLGRDAGAVVDGALVAAFVTATGEVVFHVAEDEKTGAAELGAAIEAEPGSVAAEVAAPGAAAADGRRARVVQAPFRQNLKGYEDVPSLVVNAETLVCISRVLREGAAEFRRTGTAESPGTKLFQVSGRVNKPGIFELPLGTTLRELVFEAGGGPEEGEQLHAVIVGGSKGTFYREDELGLPLDFDSVRQVGGVIGSGGVAVLTAKDCIVDQVKRRLAVTCYDTCGKCSLGREGSYQLREIVSDMTAGKSRSNDLDMVRELGRAMRLACACSSGKVAPNPVLSGLEKFPEEFEAHMKRKKCDALVCEKYVTFHILPDLCDGCGECVEKCPEEAIDGGNKKIHVVDQELCNKCGRCYEVCSGLRKAVVKAGPIKPRTPKRPIPVGSWNNPAD